MQRFSQRWFNKVVTFILREDKEKNIQQHQISVHTVLEYLRKRSLISRANFPYRSF